MTARKRKVNWFNVILILGGGLLLLKVLVGWPELSWVTGQ